MFSMVALAALVMTSEQLALLWDYVLNLPVYTVAGFTAQQTAWACISRTKIKE